MAKKYIPKKGDRFKVFIKTPAYGGDIFICSGRCYHQGHFSCVEAKRGIDQIANYAFNQDNYDFEQIK